MAFKQNLKRHMMKSHGDGKDANDKHKCEKCPFKGDKRHLKEHVERVHDKVKNELCKQGVEIQYRRRVEVFMV